MSRTSELKGIKWNCLGDSITEHNSKNSYTNYADILQSSDEIAVVRNYGLSGSGYMHEYGANANYQTRYSSMDDDADLVTVFGGTNDWVNSHYLGTESDIADVDYFYGAVYYVLSNLKSKYPNSQIVVFTPISRIEDSDSNYYGVDFIEFVDAIIWVCGQLSLPYLDLYRFSGFNPHDAVFKAAYMPDGVHPNAAGQALLAGAMKKYLLGSIFTRTAVTNRGATATRAETTNRTVVS